MARHNTRFCLFVAAVWLLGQGTSARAYEEQASLDVGVGYALLAGEEAATKQGPMLELGAGLGLTEAIVLRANLGWLGLFSRADRAQRESAGKLRIEGLYQLDVLQIVPFFGLGATAMTAVDSDARVPLRAGPHIVLGLDYLLSRRWICGLDVRSALLFEGSQLRSATDVSLRLSRMFETF